MYINHTLAYTVSIYIYTAVQLLIFCVCETLHSKCAQQLWVHLFIAPVYDKGAYRPIVFVFILYHLTFVLYRSIYSITFFLLLLTAVIMNDKLISYEINKVLSCLI